MALRILLACACLLPAAVRAQEKAVWEGRTAQEWIKQLAEEDIRARWYAAYALGELGPQGIEAAEPLRDIVEQAKEKQDEYVRATAAWALGRIGAGDEATVAVLAQMLDPSKLATVRRSSAEALGCLGAAAKPVVEQLGKALEDSDPVVRVNAAAALWKIEKHPKALPALLELLRTGKSPGPYQAATVLGQLDADPSAVAPALVAAFRHADPDVRRAAARSVGRIGRAAGPALGEALKDSDDEVRRCAVEAMGWMGTEAVGPLTKALKDDKSPAARRAAAHALGRLGPQAKSVEAALTEAATDSDEGVRDAAHKARRRVRGEEAADNSQKPSG